VIAEAYENKNAQAHFSDDLLVEDIYERSFSNIVDIVSWFYICKIQLDTSKNRDRKSMIPEGIYCVHYRCVQIVLEKM